MKQISILIFLLISSFTVFSQNSNIVNDTLTQVQDSNFHFDLISIIGLIFGAIGIIGTAYTIQGAIQKKKETKAYRYLFEVAEKNIDKTITEEELTNKKKEVEQYTEKIVALQENIEKEIPKQARLAVLKDKYFTQGE